MLVLFFLLLLSPLAYGMDVNQPSLHVAVVSMLAASRSSDENFLSLIEERALVADELLKSGADFSERNQDKLTIFHLCAQEMRNSAHRERVQSIFKRLLVGICAHQGPLVGLLQGRHDIFTKEEVEQELGFVKYIAYVIEHQIDGVDSASHMVCNKGCTTEQVHPLGKDSSYFSKTGIHAKDCLARNFDTFYIVWAYLEAVKRIRLMPLLNSN